MCMQLFKWYAKFSPATKKTWQFRVYDFLTAILPLVGMVVAGNVAYNIKKDDHFNDPSKSIIHSYYAKGLKIVGEVPEGINILRTPTFHHPMGEFFADMLPLTLIAFMESYSIARRIAAQNGELNILNASQEMVANGAANLLGCVSSSFPVSGSFSRSALVGVFCVVCVPSIDSLSCVHYVHCSHVHVNLCRIKLAAPRLHLPH